MKGGAPGPIVISGGSRNFDYGKHEGRNVKRQLRELHYHSKMMHEMLKDSDDLPDWVNTKVTLATDYIDSATHYLKNRVEEMEGKPKKRRQTRRNKKVKSKKQRKTVRKN